MACGLGGGETQAAGCWACAHRADLRQARRAVREARVHALRRFAPARLPAAEDRIHGPTSTSSTSRRSSAQGAGPAAGDARRRAWRSCASRSAGCVGDGRLGPPLCVLFEGWDASGKGGAIKRLVAPLDPRHVRVAQFAAPTPDEKRHHYLHRFWPALPGWGGMAVLDRTWYGRVLVERVEGFATEAEWRRAYDEIDEFERHARRRRA